MQERNARMEEGGHGGRKVGEGRKDLGRGAKDVATSVKEGERRRVEEGKKEANQ